MCALISSGERFYPSDISTAGRVACSLRQHNTLGRAALPNPCVLNNLLYAGYQPQRYRRMGHCPSRLAVADVGAKPLSSEQRERARRRWKAAFRSIRRLLQRRRLSAALLRSLQGKEACLTAHLGRYHGKLQYTITSLRQTGPQRLGRSRIAAIQNARTMEPTSSDRISGR